MKEMMTGVSFVCLILFLMGCTTTKINLPKKLNTNSLVGFQTESAIIYVKKADFCYFMQSDSINITATDRFVWSFLCQNHSDSILDLTYVDNYTTSMLSVNDFLFYSLIKGKTRVIKRQDNSWEKKIFFKEEKYFFQFEYVFRFKDGTVFFSYSNSKGE